MFEVGFFLWLEQIFFFLLLDLAEELVDPPDTAAVFCGMLLSLGDFVLFGNLVEWLHWPSVVEEYLRELLRSGVWFDGRVDAGDLADSLVGGGQVKSCMHDLVI